MAAKDKTTKKTAKTNQTKNSAPKDAPREEMKAQASQEDIARQAYILWLERGGSEMENWLEAEKLLS